MAGNGVCWQMIRHLKVNGVGVGVEYSNVNAPANELPASRSTSATLLVNECCHVVVTFYF